MDNKTIDWKSALEQRLTFLPSNHIFLYNKFIGFDSYNLL